MYLHKLKFPLRFIYESVVVAEKIVPKSKGDSKNRSPLLSFTYSIYTLGVTVYQVMQFAPYPLPVQKYDSFPLSQ